jgi:hypothetical protein
METEMISFTLEIKINLGYGELGILKGWSSIIFCHNTARVGEIVFQMIFDLLISL